MNLNRIKDKKERQLEYGRRVGRRLSKLLRRSPAKTCRVVVPPEYGHPGAIFTSKLFRDVNGDPVLDDEGRPVYVKAVGETS